MNEVYIPYNWASGKAPSSQKPAIDRRHIYTARAFDKHHTYVTYKAKIIGREAVRAYKREARKQYKNITYWRVYDETSQRTVER